MRAHLGTCLVLSFLIFSSCSKLQKEFTSSERFENSTGWELDAFVPEPSLGTPTASAEIVDGCLQLAATQDVDCPNATALMVLPDGSADQEIEVIRLDLQRVNFESTPGGVAEVTVQYHEMAFTLRVEEANAAEIEVEVREDGRSFGTIGGRIDELVVHPPTPDVPNFIRFSITPCGTDSAYNQFFSVQGYNLQIR